jgi:hypothetical protein
MSDQREPAQSRAQAVASYGKRQLDHVVSPAARQNAYDAITSFASERPILFAFIASQLFFSLLPLVLFVSFAVSTTLFAIVTAVIFSLFWIGVALVFLAPTLLVTGSVAMLAWLWAMSAIVVVRWVYNLLPASSDEARNGPPPPTKKVTTTKKVTAPSRNYTKLEHPNGAGAYVESDTEYRDALVKSEKVVSE